jgi:hypothetical protein
LLLWHSHDISTTMQIKSATEAMGTLPDQGWGWGKQPAGRPTNNRPGLPMANKFFKLPQKPPIY